ncbi:UbiA prenyltransferase family [Xylaria sp. CBS 124048]|nr:UbiA prenyltransferase family [Xylaria sp. CBS 124048]
MAVAGGYQRPTHGIFHFIPNPWVPYAELMRLDRQSGFWAFYWHYLIGLGFAINAEPLSADMDLKTLLGFAAYLWLWTTVFRGITCAWNDNLDQDFDRQVARCRTRPIPRGAVSTLQAHLFTAVLTAVGACVLAPFRSSVLLHASVDGALLFVYPLLKRFTDFPQVELGFGLSYPVFMVSSMLGKDPLAPLYERSGSVDVSVSARLHQVFESPLARAAGCLYVAGILWCIIFDTVYAHQDYEDDLKAGVKGLAVRLGRDGTKPALSIAAAVQVYCLVLAGQYSGLGLPYYVVSCAGAAIMLATMLWAVRLHDGKSCAWWFGPGSAYVGATVTIGLMAEFWLKQV